MKKYLLGILAIALAIGFSAFSTKKSVGKFNTVLYYHAPSNGTDFSPSSVQNKANWTITSNGESCNGANKACQVEVPNDLVDGSSFDSDVTLEAETTAPAALVTVKDNGVAVSSAEIDNRP
jgi:hypothetical protein